MNRGFASEGSIEIALTIADGRIIETAIANHRPLGLTSQLAGLSPEHALHRVSSLFSICRIAQTVAGCMAVEQALGIDIAPPQKAARAFLLRGETVLEHATCALLNWPVLLGKRPAGFSALKALRANLADLSQFLYPDGDWMLPGGGRLAPDKVALATRLKVAAAALEEAHLAIPLDAADWPHWLRGASGPAAELLRRIESEGWSGCGASDVALLDHLDGAKLERLLATDGEGAFVAQPVWEGSPRETGPLARRITEPVVRQVVAEHGRGLAARFVAQCVETVRCIEEMQSMADGMCNDFGTPTAVGDGAGLGLVEATRGWLAHRVEIADGRIRRYQILAPTEWNFHPRGPLACGLMEGCPAPVPERLVHLIVASLDPCVPWQLEMNRTSNFS
jgi:coenzyme F420-reducing hydrogenase alpha subunit